MIDFLIWMDIKVFWLITLGNVKKGETISAASWSLKLNNKWQGHVAVAVIDTLFSPWQDQHCKSAYEWQIDLYKGES